MWRPAPCWSPKPGAWSANFTGEADFLDQKECLAGTPRIYGQLVSILGKYSKFAGAGDKAAVRQAAAPALDVTGGHQRARRDEEGP
jgi:myo-inositol-1(or 4)-monophosphatase